MNLEDAINLLVVVTDFSFGPSEKVPTISILDNQKEGFVLCIKANMVTDEYRSYLEGVVESYDLWISESKGYLMIKG